MHGRLSGLTTRGQLFLACGIGMTFAAVILGQHDLLRIAVLLLVLPLASLLTVLRSRFRLSAHRSIEPRRVPLGTPATVHLDMANLARIPSGVLLVQDELPYVLGAKPRFVVDDVWSRWRRSLTYAVRSDARGKFSVGPLSLRVTDPFGLVELRRSFNQVDQLVVTPEVQSLPFLRLPGEWSGSGESRPRSIAAAGEEDVTVRSYQTGDDMRRVHWRATARHGELMVRREEQRWQSRCTIVLDTRLGAHVGQGPFASFEWAVTATASIAMHLLGRGYSIRLVTSDGAVISTGGHELGAVSGDAEGLILDALAVAQVSRAASVGRFSTTFAGPDSGSSLLVAVLGKLGPDEAEMVARLRTGSTPGLGIVVDTDTWGTGQTPAPVGRSVPSGESAETTVRILQQLGWRAAAAARSEQVASAWQRVAGSAALSGQEHTMGGVA